MEVRSHPHGDRPRQSLPVGRARYRHSSSTSGTARYWTRRRLQSTHPEGVLRRRLGALGPENIIWASAHAHRAAISIHLFCQGKDLKHDRPPEGVNLISHQNGCARVERTTAEHDPSKRYLVPHGQTSGSALSTTSRWRWSSASTQELGATCEAQRCSELRCANGVHRRTCASSATPA